MASNRSPNVAAYQQLYDEITDLLRQVAADDPLGRAECDFPIGERIKIIGTCQVGNEPEFFRQDCNGTRIPLLRDQPPPRLRKRTITRLKAVKVILTTKLAVNNRRRTSENQAADISTFAYRLTPDEIQ